MKTAYDPLREKSIATMANPTTWPLFPFLPLTRPNPGAAEPDLGFLTAHPGWEAVVFLGNAFLARGTPELLADLPAVRYLDQPSVLDDGWEVD